MSAFIVDPDHIRALAIRGALTLEQATLYATWLWRENIRSVQHRYPNDASLFDGHADVRVSPAQFVDPRYKLTPVQAIKLANCLDYQSCETDDWEQTEACALLNVIRDGALIELGADQDQVYGMPAYEAAPWTFELQVQS